MPVDNHDVFLPSNLKTTYCVVFLEFQSPVRYLLTMVGGWQKTEWDPFHSSATRTGLKSISDMRKIGKSSFGALEARIS